MNPTLRMGLAVIAGVVCWGALWVAGNIAAVSLWPGELTNVAFIDNTGILLGFLVLSIVLSIGAGWLTAVIATTAAFRAVMVLAVVQLTIGVLVQTGSWDMMPLWYHLPFLAAIVPATWLGGRLRGFH